MSSLNKAASWIFWAMLCSACPQLQPLPRLLWIFPSATRTTKAQPKSKQRATTTTTMPWDMTKLVPTKYDNLQKLPYDFGGGLPPTPHYQSHHTSPPTTLPIPPPTPPHVFVLDRTLPGHSMRTERSLHTLSRLKREIYNLIATDLHLEPILGKKIKMEATWYRPGSKCTLRTQTSQHLETNHDIFH